MNNLVVEVRQILSGDARIARSAPPIPYMIMITHNQQRESSATIKAAPATYEALSPPKAKNIIEIDSRGLEFTEFRADVRDKKAVRMLT
jgi:hypothetical protein